MREPDAGAVLAAMAMLVCIVVLWQACNERVAAQNPEALIADTGTDPRETARTDPARLYAQAVIAEAGWTVRADHVAILFTLRRRSTLPAFRRDDGLQPTARVALSYVRAFNPRGALSDRQRRMRDLDWPLLDARAPSVARLARTWASGERLPPDPCRQPSWHWGSAADTRGTALPRIDCGRTTNVYLGAPVRIAPIPRAVGPVPARVAAGAYRR